MPTGHMSGNYPLQNAGLGLKDYIKDPTLIRDTINDLAADKFIGETLFTQGYNAQGGAIKYLQQADKYVEEMSDPNQDFSIDEGAEFHQVYQREPGQVVEQVRKHAIEGWVTFEDEDRNNLGALARLTNRMVNSMQMYFDRAALNVIATNANVQILNRTARWDLTTTTTILDDIMNAADMAADQTLAGGQSYEVDAVVVSRRTYGFMRRNTGIQDLFEKGDTSSPKFGGELAQLAGIPILVTPWMRNDHAYVLERGTIGGIADEVPLTVKPIERDEATERLIIRIKRLTVAFLTDPKALVRIQNINA